MSKALVPKRPGMLPAVSLGSIDQYIQMAHGIPVLDAGEERELGRQLRDQQDLEAARRLVMSHLRFVVHIARGYSGYGLPLNDLVQEGNIGLMKAVKRFDPEQGVRLVSFAVHWIRAEIHEYILRNWRIVKVATTKAQRKLFFNLRSSKKRLGWFNREEVNHVADTLGVTPEQVLEMESRLAGQDLSFDPAPDAGDDDERAFTPASYLMDHAADPARQHEAEDWDGHHQQRLGHALATLDERSRDILRQRWLEEDKATLQTLANHYGVSAERIRQLEKNALKKLKQAMS